MFLELLQNVHKIRQRTADTVQLVDNDLLDLPLPYQLHHFLEAVTVDVAARETVVYEGYDLFVPLIGLDNRLAVLKLGLAADAVLPLHRFAGIEHDCHLTHTSSLC